MYCATCAYAKGQCAICGKQVLDISMYKMTEGGIFEKVQARDPKSFKSPEQIAREDARSRLLEHLERTGQVGRMPTRVAFEKCGKKDLAETLVRAFGGLYAAADALGLSKRNLQEDQERRKEAKANAAQAAAAGVPFSTLMVPETTAAEEPTMAASTAMPHGGNTLQHSVAALQAAPAAAPAAPPVTATASGGSAGAPAAGAASTDTRWQFDPNSGYYYQLSSGAYFDSKTSMYFQGGKWSSTPP